jgi:predicted small secreted protein
MPKTIFALLALVALAACNTISGAGQDVRAAGTAITDEAEETQSQM